MKSSGGDQAPPLSDSRVVRSAQVLLAVYALLLVVVLFSPSSRTQSSLVFDSARVLTHLGVPWEWVTFTRLEVLWNVLIIAPVSLIGSFVFARWRWQDWTAYAFLAAVVVELSQGLLLSGRQASFSDIVANTAGGCLGAVVALGVRRVSATVTGR